MKELTILQKLMKRQEPPLTTTELGRRTGLSKATVSEIARGRLPRVDDALRIAFYLEVTVEDLWGPEIPAVRQSRHWAP